MPSSTVLPNRMYRHAPVALVLVALFALTGCLTVDTLITLRKDGSGTVETTFNLTGEMLDMIAQLTGDTELCDEEALREDAAKMGEGVALTEVESLEEEGMRGCRALYTFKDINKVRISQNPSEQVPADMTTAAQDAEEEVIRFSFTPGNPATLVIRMPLNINESTDPAATNAPADSTQREMQMAMFREMFKDARIHMAVEVDGTITETNATYREGNRFVLVEMDFDTLLQDEEKLGRLVDANPSNPAEVKTLLEGVEGIKLETNEAVRIQFN